MSRNWSAVLLLGVAIALSWYDSTASLSYGPTTTRVDSRAPRGPGIPPPPGAWVQVGDDYLSRQDVQAFVRVPEVQESSWADYYEVGEIRSDSDLRQAARLVAAVHLAAREAEQRGSLALEVGRQLAQIEPQWLSDLMEERIVRSATEPTPLEVQQEYRRLLPTLTSPETRTCRHIYFSSQPTLKEHRKKSAKARAEEVEKLLAQGRDFRQLVHAYSDSSSVADDGILENLHPEDVRAEFADALWKLQQGEISPPVQVGEDYHLIHLLAINATQVEPFEDHREEIAQRLYSERLQAARRQALAQAERACGGEFHADALAADATPGALLYRVGDERVWAADYRRWLDNLPPDVTDFYAIRENRERHFREEYERGLLVGLARSLHLDESPEILPRRRANRELRLAEALLAPLVQARAAQIPVPEETLRAFKDDRKGQYVTPLQVLVDQIHVGWPHTGNGAEEERIVAAARRADDIMQKLAAGAVQRDIAALPDVSWHSQRQPQAFDDLPANVRDLLANSLQYSPLPVLDATPGALFGPVRENDHLLIVRLVRVLPARTQEYEECRAQVLADYRASLEPELLRYELESRLSDAGFRFLDQPAGPA